MKEVKVQVYSLISEIVRQLSINAKRLVLNHSNYECIADAKIVGSNRTGMCTLRSYNGFIKQ